MSETPIRVLIVDDDALVRAGLRLMLSAAPEVLIVGEAADGIDVGAAVSEHAPDVVLMDIRMPQLDGLAATELLRRRPSPPHIIILTTFQADEYVLRALRAGAGGFLLKDTPPAELIRAIRCVTTGDAMLSPAITRRLIQLADNRSGYERRDQARALLSGLTEREREIALAVGQGKSNAEIGAELYITVATVKAHVSRLLAKLEFTNRVQVAIAIHDADLSDS
jgi:DNA-binding NarL/FixJ family response regulator